MSLLKSPPTQAHLSRLYFELSQLGARAVGEKKAWPCAPQTREALLCLAAEMSRFDPRLLEILIDLMITHWHDFNPAQIRRHLKDMDTPQTWGVILAFAAGALKDTEFRYFAEYVTKGIRPVPVQLFFRLLHQPASYTMEQAAQKPVKEFLTWGFLARERPVLRGTSRATVGHWDTAARQNIIGDLARKKKQFKLADYLNAVEHTISRQQALSDLKSSKHVTLKGRGRGGRWKIRSK